jgi:tetrahydromethanopterin S-methyltransferase subunit G
VAADAWELRTARLEGAYEQVDRRLGAVEGRLGAVEVRLSTLEHKMDTGFAEIRAEIGGLRGEMHRQFYWLLGVVIGSGLLQTGLKLSGH